VPAPTDVTASGRAGDTITVTVTPTITAGAYLAGDAVGARFEVPNAAAKPGGAGEIITVTVSDLNSVETELGFVFCDVAFTAVADNAPFDITDAQLPNRSGEVPINQAHYTTFNDNSGATHPNVGMGFNAAANQTSIWGQAETPETPTWATTADLTFKFVIRRER